MEKLLKRQEQFGKSAAIITRIAKGFIARIQYKKLKVRPDSCGPVWLC